MSAAWPEPRSVRPATYTTLAGQLALQALVCREADARTRTGDPFITSEVLYQLSYVGQGRSEG